MAQNEIPEVDTLDTLVEEDDEFEIPIMQKVAILFVSLGQDAAGEVMKFLTDYEIEEITQAVAALKKE